MRRSSRKITYSALLAAISVSCMLIAQFVPLKAPLFICAICYYIALDRCGIGFGLLSIVSSILIVLMISLGTALFVTLVFAPYGIIAFLIRRFTYKKVWHIAFRVLISIIFANIVFAICYFLANIIMPEINLDKILSLVGGYAVLAVLVSLFFIVTDFFFREFCIMFNRLLK